MESFRVEIINPKAKQLLKSLADMDLIIIRKEKDKSDFTELLEKMRSQFEDAPSLDEITEEVESVRKARYEK
jgi:predicted  nucleic acid-binding Zn-ribbon protein